MHKHIVQVKKGAEPPEGAVLMTDDEVRVHFMKLVSKCDNPSETWFLKNGYLVTSGAAAMSGLIIISHYRKKFCLGNIGRISTYLPAVFLPSILTGLLHDFGVISNVLKANNECSVCLETRSGAISAGMGVIYPLILCPVSCIVLARRYRTAPVPSITDSRNVLKMFQRTTPAMGGLLFLIAAQFILGMYVAEREITQLNNIIWRESMRRTSEEEIEVY